MLLAVHISSYGCTWEVWRALKKLELLSAITPRALKPYFSFVLSKLPRAFITRYTHAKHEPLKYYLFLAWSGYRILEKGVQDTGRRSSFSIFFKKIYAPE